MGNRAQKQEEEIKSSEKESIVEDGSIVSQEEQEEQEENQEQNQEENGTQHLSQEELEQIKDQALRAMAEAQNLKKRVEREKKEAFTYAVSSFARDLLPVLDNLQRALESSPDQEQEAQGALKNLFVGVDMTRKQMITALENAGVVAIEAMGKPFDHNFHESLFEVEDETTPAGTVIQVLETGYLLHDRLLRPAKVGLSKTKKRENKQEGVDEKMSS